MAEGRLPARVAPSTLTIEKRRRMKVKGAADINVKQYCGAYYVN
jgi:hypothetical protein